MSASTSQAFQNGRVKRSPALSFYATATFDKSTLTKRRFNSPIADPASAAPLHTRNKSSFVELNVKPITGGGVIPKPLNLSFYRPNHYLEPEQLFANSSPGRTFFDNKASKMYAEAIQVTQK
jgi:hypothetical protein